MKRLRVLVACIPAPGTRYLEDWLAGISTECAVTHDHERFWGGSEHFDIIHIHWPEYMSFEIEAGLKGRLDPVILEHLDKRLRFWKEKGAKIVVHRHNLFPHVYNDPAFEKLYELVYSRADAICHLGTASREEFLRRYSSEFNVSSRMHPIIPHANFQSYQNNVTRSEARKKLGVRSNSKTVLVFGGLAREEESRLVRTAFSRLGGLNKTLLVPRQREQLLQIRNIRLKYFVRNLRRLYYTLHPWYHFGYSFVSENDLQNYLNAADVVFVQRWNPLNSGNLVLGFTFGRVVVGPNSGNVGEILRNTGNPVFEQGDEDSVAEALQRGIELAAIGHGERNRAHALAHWNPGRLGRQQVDVYRALISGETDGVLSIDGMVDLR